MSSGKVLTGVFVGLAAGAIMGILLAPDKGSNTRKKISKKGDDYMEDLQVRLDCFVESITDRFKSAKGNAYDTIEQGK